jgi:hypothetical protein
MEKATVDNRMTTLDQFQFSRYKKGYEDLLIERNSHIIKDIVKDELKYRDQRENNKNQ